MKEHKYFASYKGGFDQNFLYLIGCTETGELALIDPALPWPEVEAALAKAKEAGFPKLTKILLTHSHQDHIVSLAQCVEQSGASVYVHPLELDRAIECSKLERSCFELLEAGSELSLGKEKIEVFHTAGHQAGSLCFVWGGELFTGDTLFIGGAGRTDLVGGDVEEMLLSLTFLAQDATLSGDLLVRAGHDYGEAPFTTLAEQRRSNPFLLAFSVKDSASKPDLVEIRTEARRLRALRDTL